MAFTAQDVAKLREMTGAGMMDCKKALTTTDGDMEKAAQFLREQGIAIAAKKSSRLASEGAVAAYTADNGLMGALAEINCESDFVAIGTDFGGLCNQITTHVAQKNPASVEECLGQKCGGGTVTDLINAATAKTGEKISLRRFERFETKKGLVESYIHMGGKRGVLLEIEADKVSAELKAAAHDVAMHIAALSPAYLSESDISADIIENEKTVLKAQIQNDPKVAGKPAAVIDKMIEGRIGKFFKENCLLHQEFVKDSSKSVGGLIAEIAKKENVCIQIKRFALFVMGEGLEKKNENLADEVNKLAGK